VKCYCFAGYSTITYNSTKRPHISYQRDKLFLLNHPGIKNFSTWCMRRYLHQSVATVDDDEEEEDFEIADDPDFSEIFDIHDQFHDRHGKIYTTS